MNLCRVKQVRQENLSTDVRRLFPYYFALINSLSFFLFAELIFPRRFTKPYYYIFARTFIWPYDFISLGNLYFYDNVFYNFNSRGKS